MDDADEPGKARAAGALPSTASSTGGYTDRGQVLPAQIVRILGPRLDLFEPALEPASDPSADAAPIVAPDPVVDPAENPIPLPAVGIE